jgi:hypothetical protein
MANRGRAGMNSKLSGWTDGDPVKAVARTLYAATRNEDLEEGRGADIVQSYHRTEADAMIACHKIDVQGSDGKVWPVTALELDSGRFLVGFRIAEASEIDRDKVRKAALAKLTTAERKALGVERDAPCAGIVDDLRRRRTGDPEAFVFSVRTYQTRRLKSGEVREMERPRISRDDRDINQHFLRPAAKALGVYRLGFGFHAFRREAITEIGRAIGVQQAQAAAGHASAGMTQHYTLSDLPAQERVAEERLALLLGKPEGRVS